MNYKVNTKHPDGFVPVASDEPPPSFRDTSNQLWSHERMTFRCAADATEEWLRELEHERFDY